MNRRNVAHWFIVSLLLIPGFHLVAGQAEADEDTVATFNAGVAGALKDLFKDDVSACVYAMAQTDGPDSDDFSVDDGKDCARGDDTSMLAHALAAADNDRDDDEEEPYSPGDSHLAAIGIEVEKRSGWVPAAQDPFTGAVFAEPEDDPTEKDQKTSAMAAAMLSINGRTVNLCYGANVTASRPGVFGGVSAPIRKMQCPGNNLNAITAADEPPLPETYIEQAGIFLAGLDRFTFTDVGNGRVRIHPLLGTVDLLHIYLQQPGNPVVLPVLRGRDPAVKDLLRELYSTSLEGTGWTVSEAPGARADLTVVGAALQFKPLTLFRGHRTRIELLQDYFASPAAVKVIAPERAQKGYAPRILSRTPVRNGQDISAVLGYPFVVPALGEPGEEPDLVGLVVVVAGDVDEAVLRSANTPGTFVREIVEEAWDGTSANVEFEIPGTDYHQHDSNEELDLAYASPEQGDEDPPSCKAVYVYDGTLEVEVQDLGSGLSEIEVLEEENADVQHPSVTEGTRDVITVTATKIDPEEPARVELRATDVAGNSTTCDPVLTTLHIRRKGRPVSQSFTNLPAAESRVTVSNGAPGIAYLEVVVNGKTFVLRRLADGQIRRLDISSSMLPGNVNTVTLKAFGVSGSEATVMIHD